MDIDVLKEFVTLSLEQNYNSAARELHVSQSTLSRHISSLEKELGQKLVTKTIPLSLTPAGRRLFECAAEILESHRSMLCDIGGLSPVPDKDIVIQKMSHWPDANDAVLSAAVEAKETIPEFSIVQLPPSQQKNTAEMITGGGFDICFDLAYDGLIDDAYLRKNQLEARVTKKAWRKMGIVVRKDNPILKHENVSLKDFKNMKFIVQATKAHEKCLQSFAFFCMQVAGFTPRMEYKIIADYQQFYLIDPKESAFIGLAPDTLPPQTKDRYTIIYPDRGSHRVDAIALYKAGLPEDHPVKRYLDILAQNSM